MLFFVRGDRGGEVEEEEKEEEDNMGFLLRGARPSL